MSIGATLEPQPTVEPPRPAASRLDEKMTKGPGRLGISIFLGAVSIALAGSLFWLFSKLRG
jgi:hypothetical protein